MNNTHNSKALNDEVLNPRLQREQAQSGQITASLLWNDLSDLDLHAKVSFASGADEHIFFRQKQGTGGALDVDANAQKSGATEAPVENIYWKQPPAGEYIISVQNYEARAGVDKVPFRVQLKLPENSLDYEGEVSQKQVVPCFKFVVSKDGDVSMKDIHKSVETSPKEKATRSSSAMKAMKAMKMKTKKAMKAMKIKGKSFKVAHGKFGKHKVLKGVFEKTSGGLTKRDLMVNKRGKVVSKKQHALGIKRYSNIKGWTEAYMKARAELGVTGFTLLSKDSALYDKTKELSQQPATMENN